ncbi:MAG: Na/Pi cotransporter family protein [Deltaproteobacteria bacterium]|nr:Na/Pi cotransporter family protein [Deltaproteobacteria bacterium]MBI3293707.1 Na/Pi cotransporter family protein [Deltaproteobacteria bacterium]
MNPDLMKLAGGSALLVYAIDELSDSVQYLAGSRFRHWINLFAERRVAGVLLGFLLALLLSSSGAVTVMLVGLANARLLSLEQVFSVALGASVGSTFIVQLFAFRITEYGLLILAAGVLSSSFAQSDRAHHISRSLLFIGLMFFSMGLLTDAGKGLEQNDLFLYVINYFKDRPLVSLFLSSVLTAIIQSSAATIAFVISLMSARNGTVLEAIPWVLGANLGTTATAFFAGARTGVLGKQAALGNLVNKVVGIGICMPFIPQFAQFVEHLTPHVGRQIAHFHTFFNLLLTIMFLPFVSLGVKLVKALIPDNVQQGPFSLHYLDARSLSSPELALAQAQREILRVSDAVEQMVERSIFLFTNPSAKEFEAIRSMDQVVDFLNKGIKLFLTKLSQKQMSPAQVQKEFELLLRTTDLENIGDIIDKNILELVRKNMKKGYSFSKEGWGEITMFHAKVVEILRISTAFFSTRDLALYARLTVLSEQLQDLLLDLSEQHVQRLHQGVKESLDTTSVHLDLLGNLQRIAELSINFTKLQNIKSE